MGYDALDKSKSLDEWGISAVRSPIPNIMMAKVLEVDPFDP